MIEKRFVNLLIIYGQYRASPQGVLWVSGVLCSFISLCVDNGGFMHECFG